MRLLFLLVVVAACYCCSCCCLLFSPNIFPCFHLCSLPQGVSPPFASSRFPFTKFDCYKFVPDKISHVFFFLGSKPPLQPQPFGTDFILAFSSYINCLKLIIQILQTTKGGTQQKSIVINLNRRQVESVELPTESLS